MLGLNKHYSGYLMMYEMLMMSTYVQRIKPALFDAHQNLISIRFRQVDTELLLLSVSFADSTSAIKLW